MDRRDFFISFNSADLPHAEAINDALRDAGYRTHFHPDIGLGESRLGWMRRTLPESVQVLGLASPDYFKPEAEFSELLEVEWLMRDWVAEDPANRHFDAPPSRCTSARPDAALCRLLPRHAAAAIRRIMCVARRRASARRPEGSRS